MVSLGIFITTHLHPGYRHGNSLDNTLFDSFINKTIKSLTSFNSGMKQHVYICDTGSTTKSYIDWTQSRLPINMTKIDIPNHCGCWAAMKYLMHINPELSDNFDYLLFQVDDDGCYPQKDHWAIDLLDKYEKDKRIGVMGRVLDTLILGPSGLVEHRNCCPQIARIWGITENTKIPALHANWHFMTRQVLKDMSNIWYEPFHSKEAMDYLKKWENEDFCKLADMSDNRQTLDNVHIGREIEFVLRLQTLGKRACSYEGTAVYPNAIESYSHWKNPKLPAAGHHGEYKYED